MRASRSFDVRTPEQVVFRYELAGPAERVCAWLVDAGCMAGLVLFLAWALGKSGRLGAPLFYVGCFAIQWGYFLAFEWKWNGATPGKRIFRIRVIQDSGVRCTPERLVLRNFLRAVDFLPFLYGIGGALILLDRKGRRVGDLAAGTLCVRVPAPFPPSAVGGIRTRFNSLREDAVARARIRQVLTPRESRLVTSLALRRDVLAEGRRRVLFSRAGGYLRGRLKLGVHEDLPDESLVMNVASVLLEERTL